jgi:hypothetical protein
MSVVFSSWACQSGTWGPNGTIALSHQGEVRLIELDFGDSAAPVYRPSLAQSGAVIGRDGRGVVFDVTNHIYVWDVATGQTVGEGFLGTSFPSGGTLVNAEGTYAISAGIDHMMLWDLDPAVWRERACEAAGRNLTQEEWATFLPEDEPYNVTCPQYPPGE